MDKYELDGETYYFNNGKWLTSNYMSAPTAVLGKLNKLLADDSSEKSVEDVIKILDGAKQSDNTHLALKMAQDALNKATPSDLRLLLPRITSLYRKNDQPEEAIRFAKEYIDQYEKKVCSPALFTSLAAAYCDLGRIEDARKYANRARALSGNSSSVELMSVYRRIKMLEG